MKDSRELDLSSLQPIITGGPTPLFATISGAHLYGFASADSDVDIRGSFVLPIDTVIGLETAEETWQVSQVIDGLEVDWVAHDVAKFITMMMKKNGYVLEQLYSPKVVYGGEWLEELRELGRSCIVKYLYHHYRGFYNNECKMMAKAGATAKSVLYAYRVLLTGIHVLETSTIEANLPNLIQLYSTEGVQELITLKVEGTEKQELDPVLLQTHLARLNALQERLDMAFEKSDLPETVDNRDALSDYLVRVRRTLGA
ncbi:MAG: nucleotidyltransferase domain-containing protein [Vulcanimicrobiota bacterium]